MSEMKEWEGGEPAASPIPTPMRASTSVVKLRAIPVMTVIKLHAKSPTAMIVRRDRVSARRAIGTPANV